MALITEDPADLGFGLVDGDFITEDPADLGFGLVAGKVAGVASNTAYQSLLWSVSGAHSLRVPPGETATVALTEASTVVVVAREIGQQMMVDATTVTSVSTDETLRAEGSSVITLGEGWWDALTVVVGLYDGPPFSGYSPYDAAGGTRFVHAWNGVPDLSASSRVLFEEKVIEVPTGAWGFDIVTVVVGVDLPLTVADGAMRLDVAVIS